MAGTNIDAGAIARAGTAYTTAADGLSTVGGRLRGYTAEPADYGRPYRGEGEKYGAALGALAASVDAWRDGARAVGNGLRDSATAHVGTDRGAAGAVTGAGDGR